MKSGEKILGRISEIFFSIQGEGIYAGLPCWFVRFSGCDKKCSYCDTPYAKKGGTVMTAETAASRIKSSAPVVITGGEPTLQGEFLSALLLKIKGLKKSSRLRRRTWESRLRRRTWESRRIFLETSGSRQLSDPGIFEHISFHTDLPLSGDGRKFIRHISSVPFSLKIVVRSGLQFKDLLAAARFLRGFPSSSIVLQPLSAEKKIDKKALKKAVLFAARLQRVYPELRMLPQLHNLLDLK